MQEENNSHISRSVVFNIKSIPERLLSKGNVTHLTHVLTPCSRALQKLIVAQLIKKLFFYGPKDSFPSSHLPVTGTYPQPDESILHPPILFLLRSISILFSHLRLGLEIQNC